ncbi:hypothetical protein IFO70_01870 [Phormidium tenue FACHB-886]|nr:hypothetical protein [Phormidium tenue FACHB-886]
MSKLVSLLVLLAQSSEISLPEPLSPFRSGGFEPGVISIDVGTQILAALVVGLLTAFAFQLLLTSLGVAIGITALGFRVAAENLPTETASESSAEDLEDLDTKPLRLGSTASKIGIAAGLSILATIDLVLFAASFLAVKVTQVGDPIVGGMVGLVIWSAYFLILLWLSSAAISSVVGSILGLATAGVRRLVTAIGAAFASSKENPLTEEAAIALIQQETTVSLANFRPLIEDYLKAIVPPKPDLATLQQDLSALMQDFEPILGSLDVNDRQRFVDLIQQRTGLSELEVEQVIGQLEHQQQTAKTHQRQDNRSLQPELLHKWLQGLQSTDPQELRELLGTQLDTESEQLQEKPGEKEKASGIWQLLNLSQLDFKRILQSSLSQIAFSELQVEELWQQLQSVQQQLKETSSPKQPSPPETAVPAPLQQKLASYLRHTKAQKLTPDRVERKLQQLLKGIESPLPAFNTAEWLPLLDRRKRLTQTQRQQIVARLEETWETARQQATSDGTAASPAAAHYQSLKQTISGALKLPETLLEQAKPSHAQATLDSLFAKTSDYFDSLNLPLLDEQTIQHTLDRLLEDSQFSLTSLGQLAQSNLAKASIPALKQAVGASVRDRLGQWSLALFTELFAEVSNKLSAGFPSSLDRVRQPFIEQAVGLRDRLLQQVEHLQQETQRQIEQLKQQAQQQLEETRKAAAIAAWWLFLTAFSAAISAAIAGAIGVKGFGTLH